MVARLYTKTMPNHLTLTEMAAQIQARKLSPVELVEAHLRQIEKHNPQLNAFVILLADEARASAKNAEQSMMRGEPLGLLHGIPLTVKDSFDMQGLPTRCGSKLLPDTPAASDSWAARRFREAGAVILGKTNCPEFLMNYETDNNVIGRTNSPWDLERTPGGSSGGESAAISAFCSAGGIGSDGGGSVRVPAHFTGIAGLKPTPGRVSAAGHVPAIAHPGGLLGVAGPMARTARDVRTLFDALAGYDIADPFCVPVPIREVALDGLRIGVMEQFCDVPVQPAIRYAVRHAAEILRGLHFDVEAFRPLGIERAPNLWWFFFGHLPVQKLKALVAGHEGEAHFTGTEFLYSMMDKPEPTGQDVVDALGERDRMRYVFLKQLEQHPVILLPACGVTAFHHRERRWETDVKSIGLFEAMMPSTVFNLLGLPGMVIPFGMSPDGLPVGVQLVGAPYSEELLLDLAVKMEDARGPFPAPRGY